MGEIARAYNEAGYPRNSPAEKKLLICGDKLAVFDVQVGDVRR